MSTVRYSVMVLAAVIATCGLPAHGAEPKPKKAPDKLLRQPDVPSEDATEVMRLPETARAERLVSKRPKDRAARIEAARAHLAAGADTPSRVESAQSHARAVLQENPTDVEALLLAGQTSLLKNDLSNALRYYRTATEADANSASAFLGLGDALTRSGDEAGATAAFARFRQIKGMSALGADERKK